MTSSQVEIDPQLTLLLEIQDMRSQLDELAGASDLGDLEQAHFGIDGREAAERIREKVDELVGALSPKVRSRYQRVAGLGRVVVPVIGGVCYGCFVSIPTSAAARESPNARLRGCEHCGRFIYVVP